LAENEAGIAIALSEILERRSEEDILELYGSVLKKMAIAETEFEFLWESLQATVLYMQISELLRYFPSPYERIQPIMVYRLFLEGLFRWKFIAGNLLLRNYLYF
jgi:hypothetical protein